MFLFSHILTFLHKVLKFKICEKSETSATEKWNYWNATSLFFTGEVSSHQSILLLVKVGGGKEETEKCDSRNHIAEMPKGGSNKWVIVH